MTPQFLNLKFDPCKSLFSERRGCCMDWGSVRSTVLWDNFQVLRRSFWWYIVFWVVRPFIHSSRFFSMCHNSWRVFALVLNSLYMSFFFFFSFSIDMCLRSLDLLLKIKLNIKHYQLNERKNISIFEILIRAEKCITSFKALIQAVSQKNVRHQILVCVLFQRQHCLHNLYKFREKDIISSMWKFKKTVKKPCRFQLKPNIKWDWEVLYS